MKLFTLVLVLSATGAFSQTITPETPRAATPAKPAPVIPPGTVVLKVGGRNITAAEFDKMIAYFPADVQQSAKTNPKVVIQSYFVMEELAKRAQQQKLDQTSPVKETLELQRMQTLATAVVNQQTAGIVVTDEEQQKRYEADKDTKYGVAKIRAIFINFGDPMAINANVDMSDPKNPKTTIPKKIRLESEASISAADVVKRARSGADFAAMAKEISDDKSTGANGGEFPLVRQTDQLPDNIKRAVFSMQPGEISDPIRQQNGFYVVKVEERRIQAFTEVRTQVANDIKQERFQKWMADVQKPFEVTVESPVFFGAPAIPVGVTKN